MIQKKFKVISNKQASGKYYKLILNAAQIARVALPGQFVNIRIDDSLEPLLRRPFGIHRVRSQKSEDRSQIEILYEVKGKGTEILAQKKTGEYLDIIGPLGNGFSMLDTRYSILVGGGMGVAPLLFLAEKLAQLRTPNSQLRTIVLIGANTKNQIVCEKEFKSLGCEVKIATDDGSRGFKGYVSDLLAKILRTNNSLPDRQARLPSVGQAGELRTKIYACGPKPMLKEIALLSKKYKIPAQISLEEHMACGMGICFGCAVKTREGYKRVCKEGPVFEADQVIWGKDKDD